MRTSVRNRLFPESRMAGISRRDQRIIFFNQVNALLRPDSVVLDFGAGRGRWAEDEAGYRLAHTTLKGKCARVVGCDIDEAVLENRLVDTAVVIQPDSALPFANETFDLIVSWAVLEHIEYPAQVAGEISRILKPGGYFCAWTPNKWGYVALGARLVPDTLHRKVLGFVGKGAREEMDVFPAFYKMNTQKNLYRYFPRKKHQHFSYLFNGTPSYHANSVALARVWMSWMWLMPPFFSQSIHVFIKKIS